MSEMTITIWMSRKGITSGREFDEYKFKISKRSFFDVFERLLEYTENIYKEINKKEGIE